MVFLLRVQYSRTLGTVKRQLAICIASVALAACTPSITESDATILEGEVASLLEQGSLSILALPPSVAALKPQAVYLRPEGLYIKTSSFFTEESGVFVLNPDAAFSPARGTDPSYELVTERVFIYRIPG